MAINLKRGADTSHPKNERLAQKVNDLQVKLTDVSSAFYADVGPINPKLQTEQLLRDIENIAAQKLDAAQSDVCNFSIARTKNSPVR